MDTAGSRVTSWHIRQDVSSSQGSGRGTRVLWVGGVARSSSWTPGLPRDMGALARDSGWRLFCVSGVPREAGLVFFRRIVCLFQGAPGLRHVRSYAGGLLAGTIKEYTSDGRSRILPINSSAQPVMGQGAPINHICSKDTPVSPAQRLAQLGNKVCLHPSVQQHGRMENPEEAVSARRCLPEKPTQAVHGIV